MKKFLIALCLFPSMLWGQWQPISIPGTTPSNDELAIGNVFFITTKHGVFRSTDNALHWQFAWPSIDYPYICQSGGELFAVNQKSGLAKSADLGLTWQSLADTTIVNAASIAATDSFVYVGGSGKLHRYQRYGSGQPPLEVYSFTNSNQVMRLGTLGNEIWVSGVSGLFKSADHGVTWDTINLNWNMKGFDIHGETILVSITTNTLMRSTDAGNSWTAVTLDFQPGRIHWSDGAWFSIRDGLLRYSTDDGDSWTDISPIQDFAPGPGRAAKIGNNLVWSHAYGCLRSTDFGTTWDFAQTGFGDAAGYNTVFFGGGNIALLLGENFSANGGQSWQSFPLSGPGSLDEIIEHNGSYYGFLGQDNFFVSNGDFKQWTPIVFNKPNGCCSDKFFSVGNDWVDLQINGSSQTYTVYRSSDDGMTWQLMGNLPNNASILRTHNGKLFTAVNGVNDVLMVSNDFGATWQPTGNGLPTNFNINVIGTKGDVFVVESNNTLYASIDDGQNFEQVNFSETSPITGFPSYPDQVEGVGNRLFVLTDVSLSYSDNFGGTWTNIVANLPADSSFAQAGIYAGPDALYLFYDWNPFLVPNTWKLNYSTLEQAINIAGKVYLDGNNNGQADNGEAALPGVVIEIHPDNYAISQSDGTYSLNVLLADTIRAMLPIPWAQANPAFYVGAQPNTDRDFGIYYPPGTTDAAIDLTESTVFRPGFHTELFVTVANLGTEPVAEDIRLLLDNNLTFGAASLPPDNIIGDTLVWHIQNLEITESQQISITVLTDVSVPLGTEIHCVATVETSMADADPSNNSSEINRIVIGSFDPNDKQASPMPYTTEHLAEGEPIVYTVRFQNTGTFPADFVRIIDTLDQNLEVGSLHVLATSHPYTLNIDGGQVLNFFFDNINLPDSLTDEPGSHGFVKFSMRPKAGLQLGDQVPNRAHIYFDFNSPVITNTVISEIVLPVLPHTVDTIFNAVETCIGTEVAGILVYSDTVIYVQNIGVNTDTLLIYEVIVLPNSETYLTLSICYGTGVPFGNEILTDSGIYIIVLQNQAGCDSIVTLDLTVFPVNNVLSLIELCEHEASPLTGTVYDVEGEYTENLLLQNQYGCDSLIHAEVTVHPEELWVVDNGPLPYGTVYYGVVLTQDTQFVFYDTTQFGCLLTISENVEVLPSGTEENKGDLWQMIVSPNPSTADFKVKLLLDRPVFMNSAVYDAYGKLVAVLATDQFYNSGEHSLNIEASNWPPGVYSLILCGDGGMMAKKLVKL